MRRRLPAISAYAIVVLILESLWVTNAQAAQAMPSDITDFITRMGGWFYVTDANNDPTDRIKDPTAEYWVQVSYLATLAPAGTNNTTITMTRYNQQREDTSKGTICLTRSVVTEVVALDLRELQPVSSITQATVGPLTIWSVNLLVNGGKALVRKKTTVAPPTIVSTPAGPPTCPGLRNGQTVKTSTLQSDISSYPIQFADEGQAKYFQMLIAGAVPNMNPPRSTLAPPIQ